MKHNFINLCRRATLKDADPLPEIHRDIGEALATRSPAGDEVRGGGGGGSGADPGKETCTGEHHSLGRCRVDRYDRPTAMLRP